MHYDSRTTSYDLLTYLAHSGRTPTTATDDTDDTARTPLRVARRTAMQAERIISKIWYRVT